MDATYGHRPPRKKVGDYNQYIKGHNEIASWYRAVLNLVLDKPNSAMPMVDVIGLQEYSRWDKIIFNFSWKHKTGIYKVDLLKKICEDIVNKLLPDTIEKEEFEV